MQKDMQGSFFKHVGKFQPYRLNGSRVMAEKTFPYKKIVCKKASSSPEAVVVPELRPKKTKKIRKKATYS